MENNNGIKDESTGINLKAILAIIAIIIIAIALFYSGYILSALMIK